MKAKDTVKALSELVIYCQNKLGGDFKPTERDLFKAQAEISFKAGIKEVVDWIQEMEEIETFTNAPKLIGFTMLLEDWQAKLKEWGV